MNNFFYKTKKKLYNSLYYNSSIELIGNEKIIAQNVKKILECDEICVKLKTEFFVICIWGTNLIICDYNKEFLVVKGKIANIEIEEMRKTNVI